MTTTALIAQNLYKRVKWCNFVYCFYLELFLCLLYICNCQRKQCLLLSNLCWCNCAKKFISYLIAILWIVICWGITDISKWGESTGYIYFFSVFLASRLIGKMHLPPHFHCEVFLLLSTELALVSISWMNGCIICRYFSWDTSFIMSLSFSIYIRQP